MNECASRANNDHSAEAHVLRFVLPRPPSSNNLFANAYGRGRVKTAVYKTWLLDCGWVIREQASRAPAGARRVEGPFCVSIVASGEQPRPDLDNIIKPIIDALVKARVVDDDRHMMRVTAEWQGDGRDCVVEVSAGVRPAAAEMAA